MIFCDFSGVWHPGKVTELLGQAIDAPEPKKSELIKEALDYLESWSVEANYQDKNESIKKIGGAYITKV